jgi:hypothetical protein
MSERQRSDEIPTSTKTTGTSVIDTAKDNTQDYRRSSKGAAAVRAGNDKPPDGLHSDVQGLCTDRL